jgi:hypothetical protein
MNGSRRPHGRRRVSTGIVLAFMLAPTSGLAAEPPGEGPPDLTPYERPLLEEERSQALPLGPPLPAAATLVDLVVAAGLGTSDRFGDQETSIAIDPSDPRKITISAFSFSGGAWGAYAPLWSSADGGATWTKSSAVPIPPRTDDARGCPCDQTLDYGHSPALLYGTFLGNGADGDRPTFSGQTSDPFAAGGWEWLTSAGAAETTSHSAVSDQPWLAVTRDPEIAAQDDVYVGYTNYSARIPENHVAVSLGANPPYFPAGQDVVVSTSAGTGFIASAALRLASDPRNGAMYAAWQDNARLDPRSCARTIDFRLSRSTDHGQTWQLNGSADGILVATRQSDEGRLGPHPPASCLRHVDKFGTVNALLGGSEAVAVDPVAGDVYYVHHSRDATTGNNRLEITHLVPAPSGELMAAASSFVTGQVEAALPAVAVAANGTVGILYDTYDGKVHGYPKFTVHLAQSTDRGGTWADQAILTFVSPSKNDHGNSRQRVLGDYQQMKAVGNFFYAAFPANGAAVGRSISNIDPFFLKLPASTRSRQRALPQDR